MQWEHLTSSDFKKAVEETEVCVVAAGVVEKHGEHMPLGTDFMNGHRIACLAAEKEPAVVFMPFYFGQIYEAGCFPGALTIEPALLFQLYQGVFDEIGRNGFKKIVVYNAHGGNIHFLKFLNQCSLWKEKTYCVYLYLEDLVGKFAPIAETPPMHACECETSLSLAVNPELVKTDRIPDQPAVALGRLKDVPNTHTGVSWYSDFPEHYAGNARLATPEKGRRILKAHVDGLAEYIASVKKDRVVPMLNKEFFERARRLN